MHFHSLFQLLAAGEGDLIVIAADLIRMAVEYFFGDNPA